MLMPKTKTGMTPKTIPRIGYTYPFMVALCCCVMSCAAIAEDLLNFYKDALCADPILQAAKQQQLAAIEVLPQARAQLLPLVTGSANFGINNSTFFLVNAYKNETYTINLTQPILHFELWAKYQEATNQVKQANATYCAAEQDLIMRLATQYFAVLKAEDTLHFSIAQREAFAKSLDQSEKRFKVGLIAVTDVNISRARYDSALATEIAAQVDVLNQKEKLSEIVGHCVDNVARLRKDFKLPPPDPADMECWVDTALEQNFVLQAAKYKALAAWDDMKYNKYNHLPTIDALGQVVRNSPVPDSLVFERAITSSASLQVNIPIFSGGSISSKTRQAMHLYQQFDKDYETQFRTTTSETRQYYWGVMAQINQVAAFEAAVLSNESAVKSTGAAFRVGSRTIVDFLNAQSDLIKAELDLSIAKYEYILNSYKLKQSAGMLCPVDVYHINSWLEH